MGDVTRYTEGGREFAITGLEARADSIQAGARRIDDQLAELATAMIAVQADLRGPVAIPIAEWHNDAVQAMAGLRQTLVLTAMRLRTFPESFTASGYIGESLAAAAEGAKVSVPSGDGSVGAQTSTLRDYGHVASYQAVTFEGAANRVTTSGLSAEVTYGRALNSVEYQSRIDEGVPPQVVAQMTTPVTEPYPVRELIALVPPEGLGREAKDACQRAAELVRATADAFDAADGPDHTVLSLLASNPELSAYLTGGLTPDHMAGETVLAVLLAYFDELDVAAKGGSPNDHVSLEDLRAVVDDPNADPLLKAAVEYLLAHPTFLSLIDTGSNGPDQIRELGYLDTEVNLTSGDIELFLEANRHLQALYDGDLSQLDPDGDGVIDGESLAVGESHGVEVGLDPEVAAALAFFAENRHLATPFMGGGAAYTYDLDAITARLINGQAYAHDPDLAQEFVLSLPVADGRSTGIDISLVMDDGFASLATSALISTEGDLSDTQAVIAHLPETTSALRNQLITGFYDYVAQRADGIFADNWGVPAGDPTAPGHGGANWLIFAPWASEGVRSAIDGSFSVYGVNVPAGVSQAAADGNQWIFDDITARYVAMIELYERTGGQPSADELQNFFDTQFSDGDLQIREGFQAYVAAMSETDPVRRQELMFQANTSVAIHEQAGAQIYLERVSVGPDGIVVRFVDVEMGDGNVVHVDDDLSATAGSSNLVVDSPILNFDPTRPGGVPSIPGVTLDPISGWEDDFVVSTSDWADSNGAGDDPDSLDGTGATSWPDYEERMWSIHRLFEQLHTDPSLYDTSSLGRDLDDIAWLDGLVDW